MTQPIRSFNLDKLTEHYKSVDNAFLLSGDVNTEVKFGPDSSLNIGNKYTLETSVEFPSIIVSGVVELFNFNNNLKLTVESGLVVGYYFGNQKKITYNSLSVNTRHHITLKQFGVFTQLYIDGELKIKYTLSLPDIAALAGNKNTVYVRTINNSAYIYYSRIWDLPLFDYQIEIAASTNKLVISRNRLIANWLFDRAVSNIIIDTSSNDIYGIVTNFIPSKQHNPYTSLISPAWIKTSNSHQYINSDSFVEYVKKRDDEVSIEGWLYIESGLTESFNLIKYQNYDGGQSILLSIDHILEKVSFSVTDRTNSTAALVYDSSTLSYDKWFHIGATWKAFETTASLYINGIEESDSISELEGLAFTSNILSGIVFGDIDSNIVRFRNWRIYDIKLSRNEMQNAYKYPTEYSVSRKNVIADWKFIEDSTFWAYDCSDHGNYLYPIIHSGSQNYIWTHTDTSGFYPLMWDGYDVTLTAGNTNESSYLTSTNNSELIFADNVVYESLSYWAYNNDRYPSGNEVESAIDSYPLATFFGQYHIFETDGRLQHQIVFPGEELRQFANDPALSNNAIKINTGKWHHIVSVYSNTQVISGTLYNSALYWNGRLVDVDQIYPTPSGVHINNIGTLVIGHYLNGAISIARIYRPPSSEMDNWFNGFYTTFSPKFAIESCHAIPNQNLLLDLYINDIINSGQNIAPGYSKNFSLPTSKDITISKIPLSWKYYSVAGVIPRVPTPKFAIAAFTVDNEYSLEFIFRYNTEKFNDLIYMVDSDIQKFYTVSGLYYAHITSDVTISGCITGYNWHKACFRYKENIASFILNGVEIYSGISNNWTYPTDTIKFGFYANNPLLEYATDVKRIAVYDQWIDEALIVKENVDDILIDMPLISDFNNF